ncbi:MAG TPA: GNAT family N-acetyltransferase [Mucilaginibacter sp.]|jgi:predicted N-acetyltransferase YhbS
MENEIRIERITSIEMFEQCTELFMEAFKRAPWNDNWTKETAAALLTCYYNTPQFMGWVATSANRIIGCGSGNVEPHYSGEIFYLRELFVSIQSQKSGVGKRLMAALKEDLQLIGIKTIILFTGKTIFDFYTKSGFKEMDEIVMMIYSDNDN